MYRFFVAPEQIGERELEITGSDVNHIKNVLRMEPGEKIRVSNGQDTDYYCIIKQIAQEKVRAEILEKIEGTTELPCEIVLFQGLPKGDKMEWIIQKAVELGVRGIVPVAMKRSVVRLDAKKAEAKVKRWQAIGESAAKQSGRLVVPRIFPVMDFGEAVKAAEHMERKLLCYENARGMEYARQEIEACKAGDKIALFIGPEGGFEEGEAALAEKAGFSMISLGRRILRTETAGLCLLSVLMFQLESRQAGGVDEMPLR